MKLLIDSGGGYQDYTKYVIDGSLTVEDSINVPTLVNFQLSPSDRSFVVPSRSCYVKIVSEIYAEPNGFLVNGQTSNNNGKILATGFITNETDRTYLGLSQNLENHSFQQLSYNIKVSSDEWILNSQSVPFIPAFVGQTDTQILAALAKAILVQAGMSEDFFDTTSYMASGTLIPYYQYDPTQTWSDIAKMFGDQNRYYYKVKDRKIYYQPFDVDPVNPGLGIKYNESTQREPELYPIQLKTGVMSVPPVNDCTVIGDVEPQTNYENYFVGDGFTSNFRLKYQVFQGSTSQLLTDDWTEDSFNQGNWVVNDPFGVFELSDSGGHALGALNVLQKGVTGGVYTPIQYASYIQAQNGLELGGGLNLQHGQIIFNDAADNGGGLIGGLFEETIDYSPGNCLAGFKIGSQPALGASGVNQVSVTGAIVYFTLAGNNTLYAPGNVFSCSGFSAASFLNGESGYIVSITQNLSASGDPTNYILACQLQNPGVLSGYDPYAPTDDSGVITFSADAIITTASGAAGVYCYPLYNGNVVGTPIVSQPNHQYVLQTWIGAEAPNRYTRPYTNLTQTQTYGAQNLASDGTLSWVITDIDLGKYVIEQQFPLFGLFPAVTPPVVTKFSLKGVTLPPFAIYVLVSGLNLNVAINYTNLSLPPQGYLTCQSLTGMSGGNLPWKPDQLTEPIVYQLGFGMINQSAQISQQGEAFDLSFYTDDIPSVGCRIRFQSWSAGQSIARVRDIGAITAEAKISGDSGVRSATMSSLSPLPRTSEECEAAAAASIRDREYPQFQGSYTIETQPYGFQTLFNPSMYDYPHTGMFFAIYSPERGVYNRYTFVTPPEAPPLPTEGSETGAFYFPTVSGWWAVIDPLLFPTCPDDSGYGCGIATSPNSGMMTRWSSRSLSGWGMGDLKFKSDNSLSVLPKDKITRVVLALDMVCNDTFHYIQYSLNGGESWTEMFGGTDYSGIVYVDLTNAIDINTFDFSLIQIRAFDGSSLNWDKPNDPANMSIANAGLWVYHTEVPDNVGATPSNFIVNTVRTQVVELRDEVINISLDYGPDLYLEKLLPPFLEREQNLLTPKQTVKAPNPIVISEVLNAHLRTLDKAKLAVDAKGTPIIVNTTSGSYITIDLGAGTLAGVGATGCEVRYVDSGWGNDNAGRIGIFTAEQFNLPRNTRDTTYYLRGINGAIFSRHSKAIHVLAPLSPSPPRLVKYDSTRIVFDYAGDVRDIYGLELRAPSVSGLELIPTMGPIDNVSAFSRLGAVGTPIGNAFAVYSPPDGSGDFALQVGDIILLSNSVSDSSFTKFRVVTDAGTITPPPPPGTYYRPNQHHSGADGGGCINPEFVYDGDPATYGELYVRQQSDDKGDTFYGFPSVVAGNGWFLKITSSAWSNQESVALIRYTLNNWSTQQYLYQNTGSTSRAYQTDSIPIPPGTNISNIQVRGEAHPGPLSNSADQKLYEIWIEPPQTYYASFNYFSWWDNGYSPGTRGTLGTDANLGQAQLVSRDPSSTFSVTNGSIATGGIATVTTGSTHNFVVGDIIVLGAGYSTTPTPFDGSVFCGTWIITAVPAGNQFQFSMINPPAGGMESTALTGYVSKVPVIKPATGAAGGILLQRPVFAPADLVVDLTQPDVASTLEILQAITPGGRITGLAGYFFNLTWDYSLPTALPAFDAPALTGIIIDSETMKATWNIAQGNPDGYRVEVYDLGTNNIRNKFTVNHPSNPELLKQFQLQAFDAPYPVTIKVIPFDAAGDGYPTTIDWQGTGQLPAGGSGIQEIIVDEPLIETILTPEIIEIGFDVAPSGTFLGGPISGADAVPTFRKLYESDLPVIPDTIFVGDTGAGGVSGDVPAPPAGAAASGMFLSASGGWAVPPQMVFNFANGLVPSGTINGTNVDFVLVVGGVSKSPVGTPMIASDGIVLEPDGIGFTLSGANITLTYPPVQSLRWWGQY